MTETTNATNGPLPRDVIAERDRLRVELDKARREIMFLKCHVEMLRQVWYTAKSQEKKYRLTIQKLTGDDPAVDPKAIIEAEKNGCGIDQLLAELEGRKDLQPVGGQHGGANGS